MAVITDADIEIGYGRSLTQAQKDQVNLWIADAEMLIRIRLGDLAALDEDALKYVIREVVIARLNAPGGGESSTTVAVDDGTVTRRWEGVNAPDPGLHITDEWWDLLTPASSTTNDSSWTINTLGRAGCWR